MIKSNVTSSTGLALSDTMSEAGQKLLNHHFTHLQRREQGCIEGENPEYVHKARVAVRRMRSAMKVFKQYYPPETLNWISKGLRRTQRTLGRVRDLDVFLLNTAPFIDQLPLDSCNLLDPFIHYLNRLRDQRQTAIIEYLQGATYTQFKAHLTEYLDTVPHTDILVRHKLASELYKRYETIRVYDEVVDTISFDEMHELRIAGKELRYTLEFFEHLLGKDAGKVIKSVKVLQDHLGDLNDAHVGMAIIEASIEDIQENHLDFPERNQGIAGARVYYAHLERQAEEVRRTFKPVWETVISEDFRQAFARAISVI